MIAENILTEVKEKFAQNYPQYLNGFDVSFNAKKELVISFYSVDFIVI